MFHLELVKAFMKVVVALTDGSIEADLDRALGVASSMFLQWFFGSVLLDGLLLRSSVTIVALEFVEILIGYLFVLSSISNMISGY